MDHRLLMPRRMGGFSPLSYGSDLALWMDPSYGVYTDRSTQLTAASSQYWSVAHNSSLRFTTAMSVSCWVYRDTAAQDQTLFGKWNFSTDGGWALQTGSPAVAASEMSVFIATSAGDSGTGCHMKFAANLGTAAWHHVAMVFDGTQAGNANRLKVYLDGVSTTLTAIAGAVPASLVADTADLRIGNFQNLARYMNGRMDSVRIWGRALSAADVLLDYNSGAGKVYADLTTAEKVSLAASYDFDGDGLDSHGSNDLTGTNSPTYTSGIASGTAGDGDVESLLTPRVGGNGTPPSYAARPIWTASAGKPYHLFDGSNDSINFGDLAAWDRGAGNFTLCFAANGGDDGDALIAKDNYAGADNGILLYRAAGAVGYWDGAALISFGADSGAASVYTVVRSGTGAGLVSVRRNGVEITTGTDARTLSNAKALVFGDTADGGHTLNGRLGDVVFCTSALNSGQLAQLEAWAAARQAA